MLTSEKKIEQNDGIYYLALYKSSNILQTTYFPHANLLYVSFNRGGVYSYGNVSAELYEEFKAAESQGKFFAKTIKSQPEKYPVRKEFTLYPNEVNELKEVVDEHLQENEVDDVTPENGLTLSEESKLLLQSISDPIMENTIIFEINNEEFIKINEEGFFWKGELVEEDFEIYHDFKEWLDYARELAFNKN